MLVHLRIAVLFGLLSCLASAYSTLFLTEGVGEEGKTPTAEVIKTQKMEKNDATKTQDKDLDIEVKVIPIATDVFNQADDLFNMTPLKLVAAISAQHLLTTVNNIPIAGNSYKDSLAMLEGVVDEFNKTAQIIKLTAKYVNISGHYILSILKEFTEQSCKINSLDEDMKSVRKNFLKTITDHAVGALKELNEKTRKREMTGNDILVSSSYHIVSAFQEMTTQVLSLAAENKNKCKTLLPNINMIPFSGEKQFKEQKEHDLLTFQPILQGKTHNSIKKDQALPKTNEKGTQTTFKLFEDKGLQNANNEDLIDNNSPKSIFNTNNYRIQYKKGELNQLKVPEDMPVKYIPLQKISLFKNPKTGLLTEASKEGIDSQKTFPTKNIENSLDQTLNSVNDQDLTVEVFSSDTTSKTNNNNDQLQNQKNLVNKIEVPTQLNMKYIPIEKISLLKDSESGMLTESYKEGYGNQNPSTINKFENTENQSPKNFNNQDLRIHIFPPEGIDANGAQMSHKNIKETPFEMSDDLTVEYLPHNKLSLLNPKKVMTAETSKEDQTNLNMSSKSNAYDRELDSAAVDSLSNVPWSSNESKDRVFNKDLLIKTTTEKQLTPAAETEIVDFLQSHQQNEQKPNQCDDHLDPVCCFDEQNKKFIIFLNDCKREEHNRVYQSSYSPIKMDTCVGLFLRNPTLFSHPLGSRDATIKNVDLRPR